MKLFPRQLSWKFTPSRYHAEFTPSGWGKGNASHGRGVHGFVALYLNEDYVAWFIGQRFLPIFCITHATFRTARASDSSPKEHILSLIFF